MGGVAEQVEDAVGVVGGVAEGVAESVDAVSGQIWNHVLNPHTPTDRPTRSLDRAVAGPDAVGGAA
ncbi:hypothetical protein GCM10027597_06480 [Saccharopolyspora tripterygii]